MSITVEGWDDAEQVALITRFVRFSLTVLLGDEITDSLTIVIRGDLNAMNVGRWADVTIQDTMSEYPTSYVIRVAERAIPSLQQRMKVLAHEVAHIYQFYSGRLRILSPISYLWMGMYKDVTYLPDWLEPWEVEARGHEKGLLELFVRFYQLTNEPWYTSEP